MPKTDSQWTLNRSTYNQAWLNFPLALLWLTVTLQCKLLLLESMSKFSISICVFFSYLAFSVLQSFGSSTPHLWKQVQLQYLCVIHIKNINKDTHTRQQQQRCIYSSLSDERADIKVEMFFRQTRTHFFLLFIIPQRSLLHISHSLLVAFNQVLHLPLRLLWTRWPGERERNRKHFFNDVWPKINVCVCATTLLNFMALGQTFLHRLASHAVMF